MKMKKIKKLLNGSIETPDEIQNENVEENKVEIKPRGRKTRKSTSGE